jgi:hypothetical protein
LETFAAWQALVVAGLAVPAAGVSAETRRARSSRVPRGVIVVTALAATAFSALTMAAMHTKTIASVVPSVADLGAPAAALAGAGIEDAWELARADPAGLAIAMGTDAGEARAWIERARLATLRGIGAECARQLETIGVRSVEELARADPAQLARRLAAEGERAYTARARVWVEAARDAAR